MNLILANELNIPRALRAKDFIEENWSGFIGNEADLHALLMRFAEQETKQAEAVIEHYRDPHNWESMGRSLPMNIYINDQYNGSEFAQMYFDQKKSEAKDAG